MSLEFCGLRNHRQILELQIWTSHQFAELSVGGNMGLLNLAYEHQQTGFIA